MWWSLYGGKPAAHDRRERDGDAGGGRGAQTANPGPDADRLGAAEPLGDPGDLLGREPGNGGEIDPLVRVRLQGGQIQEDGGASAASAALERRGDQIPGPAGLQHILGWKETVVAGQAHPSAQSYRFPEQAGADLPGERGGNRRGEEDPGVGAEPGVGDFQRRRYTHRAGGFQVGQRVEHRGLPVEVRRQPATPVAVEHGIQTEFNIAGQMNGDHFFGQR